MAKIKLTEDEQKRLRIKEYESNLASIDLRTRQKTINNILKNEGQNSREILVNFVNSNPDLLASFPEKFFNENQDIAKLIIETTLTKFKIVGNDDSSKNNANILLKRLPEYIATNKQFVEKLVTMMPTIYESENFAKTVEGSAVYAGIFPENYNVIPLKFQNEAPVIENGLNANAYEVFPLLNKKSRYDSHNFEVAIKSANPNNIEDTRTKILSQTSQKNLVNHQQDLLSISPLYLYSEVQKNPEGEVVSSKTILKGNIRKPENQEIILEQFQRTLKMSDEIQVDYLKAIPKFGLTVETTTSMLQACQIIDMNNKTLSKPEDSKVYGLLKNLNLTSRAFDRRQLVKLLDQAVSVFPHALGADKKLTNLAMTKNIFYKALSQDPTTIIYGKKPLNSRQRLAGLTASIKTIGSPIATAQQKKDCTVIMNNLLGLSNETTISKGSINASGQLDGKTKKGDLKKVIKLLGKYNPTTLLNCINNPDMMKIGLFKKEVSKLIKTDPALVPKCIAELKTTTIALVKNKNKAMEVYKSKGEALYKLQAKQVELDELYNRIDELKAMGIRNEDEEKELKDLTKKAAKKSNADIRPELEEKIEIAKENLEVAKNKLDEAEELLSDAEEKVKFFGTLKSKDEEYKKVKQEFNNSIELQNDDIQMKI